MAFKIWGIGSLVEEDTFDGSTEYTHVENIEGLDINNHITQQRAFRNIYENQLETYKYLSSYSQRTELKEEGIRIIREHYADDDMIAKEDFTLDADNFVILNVGTINETFTVTTVADSSESLNDTYFYTEGTDYGIWFNVNSGGANPISGITNLEVAIPTNASAETVATAIESAINNDSTFENKFLVTRDVDELTFSHYASGTKDDAADNDTGFTISVTQQGGNSYKHYAVVPAGIALINDNTNGKYVLINKPQTHIAERQLAKIFGLEIWNVDGESISISYDPSSTVSIFNISIDYYSASTNSKLTATGSGDTFIESLDDLLTNYPYFDKILTEELGENKFDRILCEPLIEITTDDTYYLAFDYSIFDFALNTTSGSYDLFHFNITLGATSHTVNTFVDDRLYVLGKNEFRENLYLNYPETSHYDVNDVNFDNTEVINQDITLRFLRNSGDDKTLMWNDGNGRFELNDTIYINGDLIVEGTETTADTLSVSDNFIIINNGQTGTPSTSLVSGIEVERGSLTNYRFMFRENDDTFVVGESGSEQAVATREDDDVINSEGIPYWNSTAFRFDTQSDFVYDSVNGRVGINNASPSHSLDVTGTFNLTSTSTFGDKLIISSGGAEVTGDVTLNNNLNLNGNLLFEAANTPDIIFNNSDSTEKARIYSGASDGDNVLRVRTGEVLAFEIDENQKVLIGQPTETTGKMNLNGNFYIENGELIEV
jgi:hypothetical protein